MSSLVKVLFFASLRETVGMNELVMEIPDHTSVSELKIMIAKKLPGLQDSLHTVLVSINRDFAFDSEPVPDNAEVALFPPVSGGNHHQPSYLLITDDELDNNEIISRISTPNTGAVCAFFGLVREITERADNHQTAYLEYEAYQSMAEEKLRQVEMEVRQKWPAIIGIALIQRIGRLYPGTPTVTIACSAAHRDTGVFEAARYGIDRLKEIVPIWKKEYGSGGQEWIEGDYRPVPSD